MKQLAAFCAASACALLLTSCAQPDNRDADLKAIKDTETQWVQDFVTKDMSKLMAHHADDAVFMAPGGPALVGKDAIQGAFKTMLADPAFSLKFASTKSEVAKSGDLGYTQGTYQMTVTDASTHQPVNDHGSYVTAFRKAADGSWKAVADIVTSAVPPPAPAPADTKKPADAKKKADAKK